MFSFLITWGPRRFLDLQDGICSSTNDNNDNYNNIQKVSALDTVAVKRSTQYYTCSTTIIIIPRGTSHMTQSQLQCLRAQTLNQ